MRRTEILFAILLAGAPSACRSGPSADEIARLREEAHAEDKRLRARGPAGDAGAEEGWTVELRTDSRGVRRLFTFAELDGRAREEVSTVGPSAGGHFGDPRRFRGVRLSKLIEGVDAGADLEVLLLGIDGSWVTLRWEDVQKYPFLVAVERDGHRIGRAEGGPVIGVVPYTVESELAKLYGDQGFCFYLGAIAVGRPAPRMDVDGVVRAVDDLVKPGIVRRRQKVRFRQGWPATEVDLAGVRLTDVLGTTTAPIRVRSFPRPERDHVVVRPEELASCDPILVVGPSPGTSPIPLRVGGPTLLAPLPGCTAAWASQPWPAFIDGVEVVK